ncbi:transposase [Vibrio parahaemolyticus]|uniref:transposase n=1 Tax=Vibrio parahaemolyticus TaxID=670 RepID=UPI00358DC10D
MFSDLTITTALMVKRIFSLPLRALQGFINSVFRFANASLVCPHCNCISRRSKDVEVCYKTSSRGTIQHIAIDATGLGYTVRAMESEKAWNRWEASSLA